MKIVWILNLLGMIVCLNSSHKINKYLKGNPVLSLFLVVVIESIQLVNNV